MKLPIGKGASIVNREFVKTPGRVYSLIHGDVGSTPTCPDGYLAVLSSKRCRYKILITSFNFIKPNYFFLTEEEVLLWFPSY